MGGRRARRPVSSQAVSERALQAEALRLLELLGWRCYHTFDSRRSAPGFPDLIAVRGDRMLALELKSERGRATGEQLEWLRALSAVPGVTAAIVRPGADLAELAALVAEL